MHKTATSPAPVTASVRDRLAHLSEQIEHAAHLLPAQGPITAFVHHNTLHAFEHLRFTDALAHATKLFGCSCYLPEASYRQKLANDRIRITDLRTVLEEDLGDKAGDAVLDLCSRFQLRLTMLRFPLRLASSAELRWVVAQTEALKRYREDAPTGVRERVLEETRRWIMRDVLNGHVRQPGEHELPKPLKAVFNHFDKATIESWEDNTWEEFTLHLLWRICRNGVRSVQPHSDGGSGFSRLRDMLFEATGEDTDRLVNEMLIRFCSSFLDQGFATWSLPKREQGFYESFQDIYRLRLGPPDGWLRGLRAELNRLRESGVTPLESIDESLDLLGVEEDERGDYVTQELFALRGWAGMIWQIETRPDRAVRSIPPSSLTEFLAVRLILTRLATQYVARTQLGYHGALDLLGAFLRERTEKRGLQDEQRAFLVFQLAQLLGWKPERLLQLDDSQWMQLMHEIESFGGMERRRVYQCAYERSYRNQTLDAIAVQSKRKVGPFQPPRFQAAFCIDDREESIRRHLEEVAPDSQTFSFAGFYGVAMFYRGAADAHFVPLCPVNITPQHYVQEEVVYSLESSHRLRAKTRKVLGRAQHRVHLGSRSFFGGICVAMFGALASFPLVARVLFPRLTAQIRDLFSAFVKPPPVTELGLERTSSEPGPNNGHYGYSVAEMCDIAERVLRDMGLTKSFARIVVLAGHGSESVNNPHKAAYDCGACGGGPGGPNARALAQILNDSRIRRNLADRGIHIPDETFFVGSYHNTCDDSITFFDLERLPKSHRADFARIEEDFRNACNRNAHERCRRFVSAPLNMTFEEAKKHVEERSEDLAQARPECGHATNAVCFVGRRKRTRGLFMDRRTFLTSYDPEQDPDGSILARVLAPAIPVCAGISLEYYFSYVDPVGWGCGTKLPHNVASLLGVMDGAASDLRPGLPWQMTEIHEPLRLLCVIETTPERMLQIMEGNQDIARLVHNEWVQLAIQDPETAEIQVFTNGRFEKYHAETDELPLVAASVDWYRGWRDNLGYALIRDEPIVAANQAAPHKEAI